MSEQPNDIYKIIIIGDSCVGKTSLANRISRKVFNAHYRSTSGFDTFSVEISLGDRKVIFNIVDTAGQERYYAITNNFYRGSDAVLLCFDVTNNKTFENIEYWKNNFITSSNPKNPETFPFVLVSTKIDLQNREVDLVQCEQWCKVNNDAPFIETSSKADIGIKELFETVAERIMRFRPSPQHSLDDKLPTLYKPESTIQQKRGCCY